MRLIRKDIFTVEQGIICHQVNCQGIMGAGLAKHMAFNYPATQTAYERICKGPRNHKLLGHCQLVQVTRSLKVANLFGQDRYGRNKRHTNYGAVANALVELRKRVLDEPVYIPSGMGCGLGGAHWPIIYELIDGLLSKRGYEVYICQKG